MAAANLPRIIYGTACEDLVGEALQELYEKHDVKREDLWIQTKFTPIGGQDTSKPIPYNPSDSIEDQIASSLETSLKNLRTTYLDSYVLHSPLPGQLGHTVQAWKVLAKIQDEGKAKMIGVCNTYDVKVLEALDEVRKVQVVQNRWYQGNGWDKDVVGYCKRNGIMYQSFWTLSGSPDLLGHPTFLTIAKTNNLTPEQTVYKLAQLQGITPLSGTTQVEHMRQDLNVETAEWKEDGIQREVELVKKLIE